MDRSNRVRFAARSAVFVLATGAVSVFFSEALFWASIRAHDNIADYAVRVVAYGIVSYLCLFAMRRYRVRSIWALFLIGALFGWLVEGVLVATTYESLPFSISFTGLAWHAIITVVFGWWFLPETLRGSSRLRAVVVCAAAGALAGLWATGWWTEDGRVTPLATFAALAFGATAVLVVAYRLWELAWPGTEQLRSPVPAVVVSGLAIVWFLVADVPTVPLSIVVLPLLLLLVASGLRRNASRETRPDLLEAPTRRLTLVASLPIGALPAVAVAVYALVGAAHLRPPAHVVLYAITMPLGFALLGVSLWKTSQTPVP